MFKQTTTSKNYQSYISNVYIIVIIYISIKTYVIKLITFFCHSLINTMVGVVAEFNKKKHAYCLKLIKL